MVVKHRLSKNTARKQIESSLLSITFETTKNWESGTNTWYYGLQILGCNSLKMRSQIALNRIEHRTKQL